MKHFRYFFFKYFSIFLLTLLSFSFLLASHIAYATTGINPQINFQAKLTNSSGVNVTDGNYSVVFTLYDDPTAGTVLGTETDSVPVANGIMQVALSSALTNVDFNRYPIYLGVKVGTDAEMTPRALFTAVPYAFNAAKLAGMVATQSATGFTLQGGTSTQKTLTVTENITLGSTIQPSLPGGITIDTNGSNALGVGPSASSITFGATNNPSYSFNGTGAFTVAGGGNNNITFGSNNGNGTMVIQPNAGGQAGLIINKQGLIGDIFSASISGATKFTVLNNGNVQVSNFSTTGGIIYGAASGVLTQMGSVGNSNQCLLSNGSSGPVWGTCSLGSNLFQLNTGALSPIFPTDLLLGNTATTSAKFGFLNVNTGSGTPTASISAITGTPNAISIDALGTIQTWAGTSLTIGGAKTGNIYIDPTGISQVGIGFNTMPLADVDIRGNSGVTAIASISGKTGLASLIVDNSGNGDIFAASSSGLGRFVVKQNGTVGIGTTLPSLADKLQVSATGVVTKDLVQIGNLAGQEPSTGVDGLNAQEIDWFAKPATGFTSSASKVVFSNTNGGAGGQVQGFRVISTGAGGTNNSDTVGILIDGLSGASTGTPNQNAIEIGANWDSSIYGQGDLRINAAQNIIFATSSANTRIGIGTATPLASTDMRAISGTLATASVSGKTSFAGLIVDNSLGDLFTASSSGMTRMTVTQNGILQTAAIDTLSGNTLTIGNGATAKTISIGTGTAGTADTINIANIQTGGTISIGGAMTTGTVTLQAGSGGLNIGTNATAKTITIGTNTAGTADTIRIGNTQTGGSVSIGSAMTGGTITIGSTAQNTATAIIIGKSTASNTIQIGNAQPAAGATQTISIGAAASSTTGLQAINIGATGTSTGSTTVIIKAGTTATTKGVQLTLGNQTSTSALCSILGNGVAPTGGTAYEIQDCTGAPHLDYAEMYPVAQDADYGDVMVTSSDTVEEYTDDGHGNILYNAPKRKVTKLVKATQAYAANVIGVVSNNYGDFTSTGYGMIQDKDHPMPIALNGRIPVKIASTSQSIQPGDFLTTSDKPGKAMKALHAGEVIGKALESWDSSSGKEQILIYVEQGYYNGIANNAVASGVTGDNTQLLQFINQTAATNLPVMNRLTVDANNNLTVKDANGNSAVTIDAQGNAIFFNNLSVKTIKAEQIEGLASMFASASAVLGAKTADLPKELSLSTLGVTNIATISGKLTVNGEGLFASLVSVLDTLTTKNFVATGLAEFFDTVVFHKNVTVGGVLQVNPDTAGTVVIPSGQKKITVTFTTPYDRTPIINASMNLDESTATDSASFEQNFFAQGYTYVISGQNEKGFTILLNKDATADIRFNWTALGLFPTVSLSPSP